jgi:hypothetical protein
MAIMTYNGAILTTANGIAVSEYCCCCPTDCSGCCEEYTVTLSGFVDDGDDCDQLNGARVLATEDLESCYWSYFQEESEYTFIASMYCDGGKWLLSIATVEGPYADFEAVVAGTCPPETGWVLTSSYCLGGSAEVCCGETPTECPTDCSGCDTTYTFTFSASTSTYVCYPPSACNSNPRGWGGVVTIALDYISETGCYWQDDGTVQYRQGYIQCNSNKWEMTVQAGACINRWEAPNTSNCPPTDPSAWSMASSECADVTITSIVTS